MTDDYRQGSPYCVQVEFTEGCNLRCGFCGLNGIRGKENDFKFMSLETAERVASDMAKFGWNSRLEFAMHGEPTMNPHFIELVAIFRKHLPKAYLLMESNGGGLVKDPHHFIDGLFGVAGLSTLALDEYQQANLVGKIWDKLFPDHDEFTQGSLVDGTNEFAGAKVFDYPACGKPGNPHQRNKHKRLVRIHPIDVSTSGTHANLNNHAGAGGPPNDKAHGRRCAKPFREMSIRWDGSVAVCCNDWRGILPIGNINESDIEEIWHDSVFYAARRKLYAGIRDFGACDGCDALSYRPGILPDHLGKCDLDLPSGEDEALLEKAMEKGPLTKKVPRPWET